jgi:glycosyltransferase involved in cell wall biosynthesis
MAAKCLIVSPVSPDSRPSGLVLRVRDLLRVLETRYETVVVHAAGGVVDPGIRPTFGFADPFVERGIPFADVQARFRLGDRALLPSAMRSFLAENAGEPTFDLAIAVTTDFAPFLDVVTARRKVVDVHDICYQKYVGARREGFERLAGYYADPNRDGALLDRATEVLVLSWADTRDVRRMIGTRKRVLYFPMDLSVGSGRARRHDPRRPPRRFVYVGSQSLPCYADIRFLRASVARRLPADVVVNVAGRVCDGLPGLEPHEEWTKSGDRVRFTGPYADTASPYRHCIASINPGVMATGFSVRILEALSRGVPVVVGPNIARGYPPSARLGLIEACSPNEWVSAFEALLRSDARPSRAAQRFRQRWRELSHAARRRAMSLLMTRGSTSA